MKADSWTVPRVRDVEITALSARAELVTVLRLAMGVVLAAALYLGTQRQVRGDAPPAARNLLPYQALIQTHGAVDQRMFRVLQVALIEAQNVRSTSGEWPDVPVMAAEGIEPFVVDPTQKAPHYTWRMIRAGLTVTYLGIPDGEGAPAWLAMIQEPDPSSPAEAYQNDEEHARLLDGTLLHVSIWRHVNGARVVPRPVRLPQAEGWSQLFAVGPSRSH